MDNSEFYNKCSKKRDILFKILLYTIYISFIFFILSQMQSVTDFSFSLHEMLYVELNLAILIIPIEFIIFIGYSIIYFKEIRKATLSKSLRYKFKGIISLISIIFIFIYVYYAVHSVTSSGIFSNLNKTKEDNKYYININGKKIQCTKNEFNLINIKKEYSLQFEWNKLAPNKGKLTFIKISPDENLSNGPNQEKAKYKTNVQKHLDLNPKSSNKIILSSTQIYKNEKFSRFLPRNILPKYTFEEASILNTDDKLNEILRIVYTSQLNYIDVNVRTLKPEDSNRIVSVREKGKYDITKYTIPFADSIPEQLYYTMNYPIFKAAEITKDTVMLRKYMSNESGEEKGKYNMNFGVLCGIVLVEYNISGGSLDDVFKMITSAEYFKG